jgi:leucyl aminopeptidase
MLELCLRDATESYGSFVYVLAFENGQNSEFAIKALPNALSDVKWMPGERRKTAFENSCIQILGAGNPTQLAGFRRAVGAALADAKAHKVQEVEFEIALPLQCEVLIPRIFETLAETILFALHEVEISYPFGEFCRKSDNSVRKIIVRMPSGKQLPVESLNIALMRGLSRGEACNFARTLGDRPANSLPPQALVDEALARLGDLVKARVLDEQQLENEGFGGILAVGKGSRNKPRLVVLDYTPQGAKETFVLIGKGLTFDTGGYSIKGKETHNEMKYDMCGAANAIAAIEIIAKENLPVRVVVLLGCAENTIGDYAMRPGDVYRAWNGKLVEVYNTDAEGRLVLGDLLAFAGTFAPKAILDIATLTGGTTSIAGNMAGIVCTNDAESLVSFKKSAENCGEKFVHLEILDEAISDMKGYVSDLTNMHSKWSKGAPTMYAAAFLKEFVPAGIPWLHLDIANVAWNGRDNGYVRTSGATAFGARTLANWVRDQVLL